jgi:hypothetical protein
MAAALVGFAGFEEGGHGFEDLPEPAFLLGLQFVLIVIDKHQISEFLLIAPMPGFRINMRISFPGVVQFAIAGWKEQQLERFLLDFDFIRGGTHT